MAIRCMRPSSITAQRSLAVRYILLIMFMIMDPLSFKGPFPSSMTTHPTPLLHGYFRKSARHIRKRYASLRRGGLRLRGEKEEYLNLKSNNVHVQQRNINKRITRNLYRNAPYPLRGYVRLYRCGFQIRRRKASRYFTLP